MSQVRIFSCLPKPRIWKATVAVRLCGVDLDVRDAAREALEQEIQVMQEHPR